MLWLHSGAPLFHTPQFQNALLVIVKQNENCEYLVAVEHVKWEVCRELVHPFIGANAALTGARCSQLKLLVV